MRVIFRRSHYNHWKVTSVQAVSFDPASVTSWKRLRLRARCPRILYWVAVKELELSYYNKETFLCTICSCYGSLL